MFDVLVPALKTRVSVVLLTRIDISRFSILFNSDFRMLPW
jgi:hypothetical protein